AGRPRPPARGPHRRRGPPPRHRAPRLDSLRDDDIDARGGGALGLRYGPHLMEDFHAGGVGLRDVGRWIAPEQREDGDALFQADGQLVLDREVQEQVYAKRLRSQRPDAADFLAEARGRMKLGLQGAEAAGVADGSDEFRAAEIRPHRRGDDRMFDAQRVAKSRFHEHLQELTIMFSGPPQISAFCSPSAWRFRCNSYLVLVDDRFGLEKFTKGNLSPFTSISRHLVASE